jgi:hypothetical protein
MMKMQPKLITGAFAALLAVLGTAYAAENSGGGNPTSTPTWTVPVTQPSDITIKQKSSNVKYANDPASSRMAAPGGPHKCPDGTYWYEPAKACVPVGGHPVPRVQQPGAVGEAGGVSGPIEEKQSTNEICPPKCGPLGPSPTIPPAPQAAKERGGKPIGRPMECRTPPCPGEPDPSKEQSSKTTLVCCCEGKVFDNTKYKCNELGKLVKRDPSRD